MNRHNIWCFIVLSAMAFACAACRPRQLAAPSSKPFYITNAMVQGELTQVIKTTDEISIQMVGPTNIGMAIGADTVIVIDFDPKYKTLAGVFLRMPASSNEPAQSVWDMNGDGVPDYRELTGPTNLRQLFFQGEWYTRIKESGYSVISVNGQLKSVHFNGRRWVEVSTNSDN